MRAHSESFDREWDGGLDPRMALPSFPLYDVRVIFKHGDAGKALSALETRLTELVGDSPRRSTWFQRSWRWRTGSWALDVRILPHRVEARLPRASPSRLRRLVECFAQVPGASSFHLAGSMRRYRPSEPEATLE